MSAVELDIRTIRVLELDSYGVSTPIFNSLDLDTVPPSLANIPYTMAVGGTMVPPTVRYSAYDAYDSYWPADAYGQQLVLHSTSPIFDAGTPLMGVYDESLTLAGGYYTGLSADVADITTGAFTVCFFGAVDDLSNYPVVMDKRDGTGKGWYAYINNDGKLNMYTSDGVANYTAFGAAGTIVPGSYNLACWVRNGSTISGFVNGAAIGSHNSGRPGSLTSTVPLTIGAFGAAGSQTLTGQVGFVMMMPGAMTLLEHQELFARLTGLWPHFATGDYAPLAVTRSSAEYADVDGYMYLMGANWPRVCRRTDGYGVAHSGLLVESGDVIRYSAASNVAAGRGSLEYKVWTTTAGVPVSLSDGTSSNRIVSTIDGYAGMTIKAAGTTHVDGYGSVNVADGYQHTVRLAWKTNLTHMYVDGVEDWTPDTVCTVPSGLSVLELGQDGYQQVGGLVSNIRVFRVPCRRG